MRGWGTISAIMIFRPILLASALEFRASGARSCGRCSTAAATAAARARAGLNDKGLVAFDNRALKPAYELYRREWPKPDEK